MGVANDKAVWQAETEGVELLDLTIGDMFDQVAQAVPDREAVVYDYPELDMAVRLDYRAFQAEVNRLAKGVLALGIQAGDKVAVLAPNIPEWLLLEMALAKIGAVLVTVNTGYRAAELEYLLRNGDIHTLFTVPEYRNNSFIDALHGLLPELSRCRDPRHDLLRAEALPRLRRVVLMRAGTPQPGCLPFDDVLAMGDAIGDEPLRARQAGVKPGDVVQIQYTSGTTGHPKGVMLTHHSTLNNAYLTARRAGLADGERFLACMPLFHTAGCVVNVLSTLLNRGTLVMGVYFDARKMLELIDAEKPSIINMVPTMLIAMLADTLFQQGRFNTRSITKMLTGGTSIPVVLIEEVQRRIGGNPMIVLGLTETSPIVCQTLPGDSFELKSATVGQPLPHTSVKVVDQATGEIAGFNRPGELMVKGYLVMQGYYQMPDKTAETIDAEGWLHTGDLGMMDEQGYVRVIGRLKDMIIRGGENIYPVEIEEFLLGHEAVEQAAVVAVPDDYMGEEAAAVLRLVDGASLDEDALRQYCRARISRHKVPKYFLFVDEFPLTASGKFRKNVLRGMALTMLGLQKKENN